MARYSVPGTMPVAEWELEVCKIRETFVDVVVGEGPPNLNYHSVKVRLQPFTTAAGIAEVAAHMAQRLELEVDGHGTLMPRQRLVAPIPFRYCEELLRPYTLELIVMRPPAYPRMYVVDPVIDSRRFRHLRHLHRWGGRPSKGRQHPQHHVDKILPLEDICYIAIPDQTWVPGRDPLYELFDMAAQWLGCFLLSTYGGHKWLNDEAPHHGEMAAAFSRLSPCPCGSGHRFGNCHYGAARQDSLRAVRGLLR